MKNKDDNYSKLFKLIGWRVPMTAGDRLLGFLTMLSLMIIVLLSSSACGPPLPTPTPTPTPFHYTRVPSPTSTYPLTPTVSKTPTPTPLPPVTLEEPEDGVCLACRSDVTLRWSCPYVLHAKEYYRVRLKGQNSIEDKYCTETYFPLRAPSPGEYQWSVALVRATAQDEYARLSEEAEWRSFRILPPPVVHSISPTRTVQDTGVTVVVSGENFTPSLALTIGVPLRATFVNTSTITATIPMTLEVGEYPVVLKDSLGQGESFASFIVSESTSVASEPASSSWDPTLPVPTAVPGYNPSVACVINPCAPAPQLIGPQDGTEFIVNSSMELRWEWAYCLPPEWKFAIRISETAPHSYRYEDNPKLISCEDGKAVGRYRLPEDSRFRTTSGTYYWNIAVARSVEEGKWERLSKYSEIRSFIVQSSGGNGDGDGHCPPDC